MFCTAKAAGGHGRRADVSLLDCIILPSTYKARWTFDAESSVVSPRQPGISQVCLTVRHKEPWLVLTRSILKHVFQEFHLTPKRSTGVSHQYMYMMKNWLVGLQPRFQWQPVRVTIVSSLKSLKNKNKNKSLTSGQFYPSASSYLRVSAQS